MLTSSFAFSLLLISLLTLACWALPPVYDVMLNMRCYVVVRSHLVKRDCYVVGSHLVKRDCNVLVQDHT